MAHIHSQLKITADLLATASHKGRYLVASTTVDHLQPGCDPVPAGTVGVVKVHIPKGREDHTHAGKCVFVYPHPPGTKRKDMSFSDGQVRVIPWDNLTPLGRVG